MNYLHKEINHLKYKMKFWNETESLGSLKFEIIENMSHVTEILLVYSRIANRFSNLDLNVTAAIHFKVVDRVKNLKSIIGNIFRYSGFGELDESKMKSITKITRMYPDFGGAMEIVHKRSRYLSFLFKAIKEDDLAKKINKFADSVRSISEINNIGDDELKNEISIFLIRNFLERPTILKTI